MLAPETPSMVEWCIFTRMATRPSASPSITHISHRGRSRRSGQLAMSPTTFGQRPFVTRRFEHDAMEMAIDVQVRIIDPERPAQVERRLCQLLANRGNLGETLEKPWNGCGRTSTRTASWRDRGAAVRRHAGAWWASRNRETPHRARVPKENALGHVGEGHQAAQDRLGAGRIYHCMNSVGQMWRAFDLMVERARTRQVHGGLLQDKQFIQGFIADSYIDVQAARLMTLHAAEKIDQGLQGARTDISAIKVFVPAAYTRVVDRAIQVWGAAGIPTTSHSLGCSSALALCGSPTDRMKSTGSSSQRTCSASTRRARAGTSATKGLANSRALSVLGRMLAPLASTKRPTSRH